MHDNKLGYEKLGIILALLSSTSFCVDTNRLSVAVKFSWYVVHVLCVRNVPTVACTIFGEHFTWLVQAVSRVAQVESASKVCVTFVYVSHQMHPLFCVTFWVWWSVCISANTVQSATFYWAVAETILVWTANCKLSSDWYFGTIGVAKLWWCTCLHEHLSPNVVSELVTGILNWHVNSKY